MNLLKDMHSIFRFLENKKKIKKRNNKNKTEKKRNLNFFSNEIFKQV